MSNNKYETENHNDDVTGRDDMVLYHSLRLFFFFFFHFSILPLG